MSIFIW